MLKKMIAGLAAVLLLLAALPAGAEIMALSGTVVNMQEETVFSALGGTVEEIYVRPGDAIQAGEVIAKLKTRRVYALQDGVARIFGEAGESVEMIANQYGAVAYVEPALAYTAEISTKTADTSNEANSVIHPGETVYLRVADETKRAGSGMVTSVSGGSFTVLISQGNLRSGDSVNAYRDPAYLTSTRLGKGSVSLADPAAYTGEGVVAAFSVENGAAVKKGDVLYELLDGSYSGNTPVSANIVSSCDGILASLNIAKGSAVGEGAAAAVVYPDDALRVEALVSETDLQLLHPGDAVTITFTYLNDGLLTARGTIESISRIGEASGGDSEEAWFRVYVKPENIENMVYGAHALVETDASSEENKK